MTSLPIREQVNDHLLTPKNATLIIIDFQPVQVSSIASMDRRLLVDNIVRVAKIGRAYGLPIVLSTVNVNTGINKPTIHQLQTVLDGIEPIDRTTINAWEDEELGISPHWAAKSKPGIAAPTATNSQSGGGLPESKRA